MESLAYDVILWDWNGTLLDDGEFGRGIIDSMLTRRNLPVPDREEHRRLFDFPVFRYYQRLGFDFADEPFEQVSQEFVDAYIAQVGSCNLRAEAVETLEALRAAGYRQSVLSASRQDYLEQLIGHYGLEQYFEELLGIDSVHAPGKAGRGKAWIRDCGISPRRVLLIGDTVHDAEVATEMGVDCWLLEGGHHATERLQETKCQRRTDLASVRDALLNVSGNWASA